jgi:hypothetical protein
MLCMSLGLTLLLLLWAISYTGYDLPLKKEEDMAMTSRKGPTT